MGKRRLHKEVAEVVKIAEEMGFVLDDKLTGSGHIRLRHPNGASKVMPSTPGSPSWKRNAIKDLSKIATGVWSKPTDRTKK